MTVKVGIIGMGFMGRMHLSAYRKLPGVEVVAFADTDASKRAGTAGGAGNLGDTDFQTDVASFQQIYDCGFALVDDPDIDLVDICVPTCDHKDLFLAAVAARKHVLSEKPMAVDPDDVKAMVAAGKKAKTVVMIAHCIRFWPAYVLLKECVDTQRYGACKSLILRRQGSKGLWSPWYFEAAVSGGALYDLHVHDTDYVNFLFGKPRAVSSVGSRGGTTDEGVDHVVTHYYFPKRTVEAVTAIGAWHQHKTWPFYMGYTAVFERATLDFDINRPQPVMLYTDEAATAIDVAPTDGWFEEIKYMVQCVTQGEPPALNTIASARVTMKIVQAEERSIRSGKVEKVK
ncbi:MAG: Gfo/Idh/MocA family oxidoreductase [Pirellulaceae bacterium]|jgi:predicted dehydrogenase|nr:Gfo/Idh/MocA family oxidoreductase [Pirellulaceae bacterium]